MFVYYHNSYNYYRIVEGLFKAIVFIILFNSFKNYIQHLLMSVYHKTIHKYSTSSDVCKSITKQDPSLYP